MENLIEELTKVNPSNLSEEGLKLFNKINEIIYENKVLEEELKRIKSLDIYKLVEDADTGQLIHKSKIKEKIEEIMQSMNKARPFDLSYIEYCEDRIEVLEELLKEDK